MPYLKAGEAEVVMLMYCCWVLGVKKTVYRRRHLQANEA